MRIVGEEADESIFFFELLTEFYPDKKDAIKILSEEGEQLLKIIVASINTSRG